MASACILLRGLAQGSRARAMALVGAGMAQGSARSFWCFPAVAKSFVITSNEDFEQKVMQSPDPVIVNFHADWCEPCKILTPRLQELVGPLERVHLAVIDVEKNIELVHTFEVKAVPAVLAVRNGQVEDKFIGLVDGDMIDNLIKKLSDPPPHPN